MRYQVQQTPRLEDLAIQALARWIIIPIQKVLPIFEESEGLNETEASNLLSRHIESIRYRLQCNVSRELHDKLAAQIIKILAITLEEDPQLSAKVKDRFTRLNKELIILGRVIETIFTKYLTRLTVDNRQINKKIADMFIKSIYLNPDLLQNLVRFDLVINMKRSDYFRSLQESNIPIFKKLRHLSLDGSFCRSEVLQTLVDNCKLIENLELFGHNRISLTFETMTHLKHLSELRYFHSKGIYFPYTDFTKELLMACENIEIIDIEQVEADFDNYHEEDNLGEAIKNIIKSEKKRKFKLKFYRNNYKSTPQSLALIIQTCPIEEMLLTHCLDLEHTKNIVKIIPNLVRLKLREFDLYEHKIHDMLLVKGINLVELHFQNIDNIDLNALITLSKACPNLECLNLENCGFGSSKLYRGPFDEEIYIEETNFDEIVGLDNPPFVNLKRLSMSGYSITRFLTYQAIEPLIYFLLVNSLNIEYVSFTYFRGVVLINPIISKVLENNPLSRLKKLYSISSYSELSEMVIDKLIRNNVNEELVIETGYRKRYTFYYETEI